MLHFVADGTYGPERFWRDDYVLQVHEGRLTFNIWKDNVHESMKYVGIIAEHK